jgi:hypothetical protein
MNNKWSVVAVATLIRNVLVEYKVLARMEPLLLQPVTEGG